MAHDRLMVLNALIDQGVVPIFSHSDVEVCVGVIEACARAGAPCVEFTNRETFASQVFQGVARRLAAEGSSAILGVGSVVDAPTAALFLANGASFVVGPTLSPEIARLCNRRGVAYSPGCGSATEIGDAQELGCEIVKLFPGGAVGGPGFVKSVLGPMPWSKIMPTGGVDATEQSLRPWFEAGIVACGMGSSLLTRDLLEARDYARIEARVRDAVTLVRSIRGR